MTKLLTINFVCVRLKVLTTRFWLSYPAIKTLMLRHLCRRWRAPSLHSSACQASHHFLPILCPPRGPCSCCTGWPGSSSYTLPLINIARTVRRTDALIPFWRKLLAEQAHRHRARQIKPKSYCPPTREERTIRYPFTLLLLLQQAHKHCEPHRAYSAPVQQNGSVLRSRCRPQIEQEEWKRCSRAERNEVSRREGRPVQRGRRRGAKNR